MYDTQNPNCTHPRLQSTSTCLWTTFRGECMLKHQLLISQVQVFHNFCHGFRFYLLQSMVLIQRTGLQRYMGYLFRVANISLEVFGDEFQLKRKEKGGKPGYSGFKQPKQGGPSMASREPHFWFRLVSETARRFTCFWCFGGPLAMILGETLGQQKS